MHNGYGQIRELLFFVKENTDTKIIFLSFAFARLSHIISNFPKLEALYQSETFALKQISKDL